MSAMYRPFTYAALMALCVLFIFSGLGCSKAGPRYDEVFSSGQAFVKLCHDVDKLEAIVPLGMEHPYEIDAEHLAFVLEQVTFQEYGFLKWRDRGRLFYDEEVAELAQPLSQALAQAGPDQVIVFRSSARKRDLLLPTNRLTSGMLFHSGGELQLVIGNLNWEQIDPDAEYYQDDPRERTLLTPYRLVVDELMTRPPVDKNERLLKREHNNWLQFDVQALLALAQPEEEPASPVVVVPVAPNVEQRLQTLKELYEQELITQEEYEQKRQEILDEL
ncbi:MAG: SHOCT domain-containing protein [Candidatus Alcyoniella australis]|nr:SHOCT domain-containing protein [Candidatus Alcyoniella australis]